MPVEYPRVPGHEVIGRIDAGGHGVEGWEVGDRFGVGWLGDQCNRCAHCRRGDFVDCENQSRSEPGRKHGRRTKWPTR
jgi:D-arabinose 1-dehydrogenase-like Zn-dependent alcohol dehydrogenase